jgi:hypothetical protein
VTRDADEHVARATIRRFHEVRTEVRIGLAFTGDRDAAAELVKQFDLDQDDDKTWIRGHSDRDFAVYHSWGPTLRLVSSALEKPRPELAQKLRRRMLMLWQIERDPASLEADPTAVDRIPLTELKKSAELGILRGDAMRRWAWLEPEAAKPWLTELMNNADQPSGDRLNAAAVLAQLGDVRGLDWLKDIAFKHPGLGGRPGAAMLESGDAGAALYFKLVAEHEKNSPDKPLPASLANAAESCSPETLFKHLPRLLSLKDEMAAYRVRYALRWQRLTAYQLAFLTDHLRQQKYEDETLGDSLWHALSWK